ncbi:MAG: hypothetical protein AAGK21_00520 [Bacteroidota bacterium]
MQNGRAARPERDASADVVPGKCDVGDLRQRHVEAISILDLERQPPAGEG